jgi:hypothetical protein
MNCINCNKEIQLKRKFCSKSCSNSYNGKIRYSKIEITIKKCRICEELKSVEKFNIRKGSIDGYRNDCKKCLIEKSRNNPSTKENKKRYYQKNKEKVKEKVKKRVSNNKEYPKNRIKIRSYRKSRYNNDPLYKLTINIRGAISKAFKRNGYKKNSKSYEILGCTFIELKIYIESQFKENMDWSNHGKWHIDHKIPISWAKTEEEIIKLSHYTNLQPMWAEENIKKKNYYASL